jgi:catechol 2,3-dioxygenase-like lactoylglutathione lyase family enzyme
MILGINHINLSVSNIDISFKFYNELLGLKALCKWPQGAYLLAGEHWFCLNVTKNRQPVLRHDYTHYAFSVSSDSFLETVNRLIAAGIKPFKDNLSEGDSFYFKDPDGHQLEIHVGDWQSRIEAKKSKPWPGVEFFV